MADAVEITGDVPNRTALLAELDGLSPAEAESGEAEAKAEEPVAEIATEPAEEIEEAVAETATEETVEEEPAPESDPQLAKRLAAIQKAEKRAKEAMAAERAAWEKERAEWAPKLAKVQDFEALARRAKYDPAGALMALGLSRSDLNLAARHVFAESDEASADPKNREAVQRSLREREADDRISRIERENAELRQEMRQRDEQLSLERKISAYMDGVVKSIGDDTPLVRTMMSKAPEKTQLLLAQTAERLAADGEVPDHADVVKELEKLRKAELEELGVDVSAVVKIAPAKKPAPAPEKKPSKTLSNDLGAPTKPRTEPRSEKEERDELLKALESGQLE